MPRKIFRDVSTGLFSVGVFDNGEMLKSGSHPIFKTRKGAERYMKRRFNEFDSFLKSPP